MTPKAEGGRESRTTPARDKTTEKPTVAESTERRTGQHTAATAVTDGARLKSGEHDTRRRSTRYLVTALTPLDMRGLVGQLEQTPGVKILRTVESESGHGVRAEQRQPAEQTWPAAVFPPVLVIEADAEQAAMLASAPQLLVEPDLRLEFGAPTAGTPGPDWFAGPVGVPALGPGVALNFHVKDDGGHALHGATVTVDGPVPACAVTGADGKAKIELPLAAVDGVLAVRVRPRDGSWSSVFRRPHLSESRVNEIECTRLEHALAVAGIQKPGHAAAFPHIAVESWARQALGFERVPPHYLGSSVRLALIDSGAAVKHPDLGEHLDQGWDVVSGDGKAWREDALGCGTHCATLIVGTADGTGVVGLAPEAELHVLKAVPHGRLADLIEALDYCIEQQIDVAQFSVGIPRPSRLLAAKVEQARRSGVLCVAAVGDAAGPVAFPAALPSVLGVGAIGRIGTYPPDSCHAEQVRDLPTPGGFFAAASANHGPGLDLVAPGVAVVGGAPTAGYTAQDGTATATAHISALAALVLAHHPDFHTTFRVRGPQRVDHLKALLVASCRPIPAGPYHAARFGAGIPDAAVAVGIAPPGVAVGPAPWAGPSVAW